LSGASKYCGGSHRYPNPSIDEAGFVASLSEFVRAKHIDVVLPMTDITTMVITQHRHEFEPHAAVPVPSFDVIAKAADKVHVIRSAERLGVAIPRSLFVTEASEGSRVSSDLPYPVVVKPRRSRVRGVAGWEALSVSYAADAAELERRLSSLPADAFPVIVQERIKGPGVGVFMCYANGAPVAEFAHRRLREKPPTGGVSTLCESMAMTPELREAARTLLDDLGWSGVAMVEFKVDNRTGRPLLMEINGRFWGSLQLATDAGVDFPSVLLDSLHHDVRPASPPYRVGVQSRWLWGDFDSLLLRLLQARSSDGSGGKMRSVLDFLHLWHRDMRYENPRLSDIGPWFRETSQRLFEHP